MSDIEFRVAKRSETEFGIEVQQAQAERSQLSVPWTGDTTDRPSRCSCAPNHPDEPSWLRPDLERSNEFETAVRGIGRHCRRAPLPQSVAAERRVSPCDDGEWEQAEAFDDGNYFVNPDPADYALEISADGRLIREPPAPRGGHVLTETRASVEISRGPRGCLDSMLDTPTTAFPPDQREKRTGNKGSYPWGSIGAVTLNGVAQCTGTLIGPRTVLTCAHCLVDGNSLTGTPGFIPGRDGGTFPNGEFDVVHWYAPKAWREDKNFKYDWLILITEDSPVIANIGWFGLKSASGSSLKSVSVWNMGYPASDQICPPSVTCGGFLWGDECFIEHVFSQRFWYKCDITKGHSGGPTYRFNGGNRQIVGIQSTQNDKWNKCVRVTGSRLDLWCSFVANHPSQYNAQKTCI